jgi:hypothetical protein
MSHAKLMRVLPMVGLERRCKMGGALHPRVRFGPRSGVCERRFTGRKFNNNGHRWVENVAKAGASTRWRNH